MNVNRDAYNHVLSVCECKYISFFYSINVYFSGILSARWLLNIKRRYVRTIFPSKIPIVYSTVLFFSLLCAVRDCAIRILRREGETREQIQEIFCEGRCHTSPSSNVCTQQHNAGVKLREPRRLGFPDCFIERCELAMRQVTSQPEDTQGLSAVMWWWNREGYRCQGTELPIVVPRASVCHCLPADFRVKKTTGMPPLKRNSYSCYFVIQFAPFSEKFLANAATRIFLFLLRLISVSSFLSVVVSFAISKKKKLDSSVTGVISESISKVDRSIVVSPMKNFRISVILWRPSYGHKTGYCVYNIAGVI